MKSIQPRRGRRPETPAPGPARRSRLSTYLERAALVAVAFAGGVVSTRLASATPESASPYLPFDQMARVMLLVEHDYVEPAQREKLLDGAIRGMVAELDPHSSYMNAEEYAQFLSDTEGKFGGVGVEVDLRDDEVTVVAPIEGSPAERGGLRPGDRILAVDGKPLRGLRIDRIVTLMRGEPGTIVEMLVARKGHDTPLHFTLTREIVHVSSVEGKRLDGDVLYLRLKQFQETTHDELLQQIASARKGGAIGGALIDMRFNPGGLVDEAELVADEVLSSGEIYSTRHRGRILDERSATPGGALSSVPVVVLVNEYSASAAELVAGALQDNGRATIVGAPTFGKGSVQTIFDLPGGAGLRLTTMRYYTPSGRAIQANGVVPDVLVKPAERQDVVREADLDGHLAAEHSAPARPGQVVVQAPPDPKPSDPILRVADVPADPGSSTDFALAEAYRRLRAKMDPGAKPGG